MHKDNPRGTIITSICWVLINKMFFHPNPCPRCQVVNLNGVLFPVKFKVLIVWPIQTSNKFDYISEGSNQKFTHKSSECKLALFLGIVVCWFKILYLFFHNMWSNPDQAICPCTKQGLINIINILFQADLQQSKWTAGKQMDFAADKKELVFDLQKLCLRFMGCILIRTTLSVSSKANISCRAADGLHWVGFSFWITWVASTVCSPL